jgi:transposase
VALRGEVLGRVERRRRWSIRDKLAVVVASLEYGAVVSDVARRFDVTRQQVYDRRRAARRGDLGVGRGVVGFVEVVPGPAQDTSSVEGAPEPIGVAPGSAPVAPEATSAADMTVEIVLVGGRVLRVPTALPTAELRRLIGAVEGA